MDVTADPFPEASDDPTSPLPVSVVIAAYNRPEMTRRAVASALGQRPRPPAEVIVVDDASTDGTAAAAAEAGARVVRHPRNQGEGAARNTAIGAASQPWIGVLDSDDAWHPDLLATLWPLRADHVLLAGAALYRRAGGGVERYAGLPRGARRRLASPRALIAQGNPIPASGVLARREVVLACGGFDASLRFCADLDLWLRMLEHGSGMLSARPVVDYHLHAGQVTRDRAATTAGHLRVLEAYADRPWFSRSQLEAWRGGVAWDDLREALDEGRRGEVTRTARFLAGHPARPVGLARLLLTRALLRRRLSAL